MVLPLLLSLSVFALLLTYQLLRPRLRCEPVDERAVLLVHGRISGPKQSGEVVCRVLEPEAVAPARKRRPHLELTGSGEAELPLILDLGHEKVLVLARGAVVTASWPHRRPELRVGDRVTVAGVLGDLRRDEALYREPGCAYGLEALRIVVGGLPRLRWLTVPLVVAGALALGCLLLLLSPLARHSAPLLGLPCPPGTRLEGRPVLMGSTDWTQICRDPSGRAQGPTVRWSAAGTRQSEGHYRDGRLDGPWQVWRESGRKTVEGGFVRGERHGRWTEWSAGRLQSRGRYVRGKKQGRWTVWREVCTDWASGPPASAGGSYPFRMARLGSVLRMRCTYRDGRLHGPFSLWLEKGGTRLDGHFRAGNYHGRWTWRNRAGVTLLESGYKDGLADGRWIRWSAAGKKALQGSYTAEHGEGRMSGRWTRYRANGTIAWSCAYADGLAAGWLPPCARGVHDSCRGLPPACDARLQDVVPGPARARGGLGAAEIDRLVYLRLFDLSLCHRYLDGHGLSGVVTVSFTVTAKGRVERARVLRSTLGDRDVSMCIANVLSEVVFRPATRSTRVRYPVRIFHDRSRPSFY